MDLKITESAGGYKQRTIYNVLHSDVTIAFAVDFSTTGEKLTASTAATYHKPILKIKIPTRLTDSHDIPPLDKDSYNELILFCFTNMKNDRIHINIAGNAIQRFLKYRITQKMLNAWMVSLIEDMKNSFPDTVTISIRSGGQSGADIAGIVAGLSNGIPCTAHFPLGYMTRNETGVDQTYDYDTTYKFIISMI